MGRAGRNAGAGGSGSGATAPRPPTPSSRGSRGLIRLAWRQIRTETAIAAAALGIVALVLALTGPHLLDVYDSSLAACRAAHNCGAAPDPVPTTYRGLQVALESLVLVVPALVGIFWGAPLVARGLETGTYRLTWTQSVSRARWLTVKLGLGACSAWPSAVC